MCRGTSLCDGTVNAALLIERGYTVEGIGVKRRIKRMKLSAVVVAVSAVSASAFVQPQLARPSLVLNAEKKSLFQVISDMDLFAPKADQNKYGARNKKNLAVGKLGANSYIPAGLTAAEYEKIRSADAAKKDANYKKNVAKAGKFLDYTDFYTKRGTDTSEGWFKSATRGHTMAKTKYDWSGSQDNPKQVGLAPKKK